MQIKDIARMAGVAPSTVSRVINDSGYVSAEVRGRVEEVIRRTGYVPNSIAKSLKAKRSHTIGVIVPRIASEAMARQIQGIAGECEQRRYEMLLANAGMKDVYKRQLCSRAAAYFGDLLCDRRLPRPVVHRIQIF